MMPRFSSILKNEETRSHSSSINQEKIVNLQRPTDKGSRHKFMAISG
jgi:hypothetical protein